LYFLVAGSVLTSKKLWYRFFKVSTSVAVLLSIYSFAQLAGEIQIHQGGWRLDGTFGNAAYMAVYMLFHIAFATLLFFETKKRWLRHIYGGLIVVFGFLLVQTATRGAILGLAGGVLLAVLYALVRGKKYRKVAGGVLLGWVLLVGVFIAYKDSSFIQESQYLSRVANITLAEGETRFTLWGIALEGVKEKPLLGWGHENFNYVFNAHYVPELYNAEQWYDRVHNIVFDWFIAGGILGATTYFSLLFFTLYYLWKREDVFSTAEQSILFGLLGAYFFHNLFVFDNVVSYVFYVSVLAYVHSRVGSDMKKHTVSRETISHIVAPMVILLTALTVYAVNVPAMRAGAALIDAFQTPSIEGRTAFFRKALSYDTFGNQEIREQLLQVVPIVYQSEYISDTAKQQFAVFVDGEVKKQVAEKPLDARIHMLAAPFYRIVGVPEQALQHLSVAAQLSPQKPQVYVDTGLTYLQYGALPQAVAALQKAHKLEVRDRSARLYYGLALILSGDMEGYRELTVGYEDFFLENELIQDALGGV